MIIKDISEIKTGMTQSFKYTPINKGSVGSNELLKLCEVKQIDKNIAAIAKYLYKFKCAPIDYLCEDLGIEEKDKYFGKMMYLTEKRIFNAFVLTDSNDPFDTKDHNLVFFTLDYGALFLLRAIDDDENIENWKAIDVIMTGLKVKKTIMLLDFYRKIRSDCEYFIPYRLFLSYGARIRTRAMFKAKPDSKLSEKLPGINLVEIVSIDDIFEDNTTNMVEKIHSYEKLLCTDGWSYDGLEEVPTLIILGDSPNSLKRIKEQISDTKIEKIKYMQY